MLLRFCRWARCVVKEGLFRLKVTVDKHCPVARYFYVNRSGDPDTYRTFFDDSCVGIHPQWTKDPQERKDRVREDMTWYGRAYLFNPKSITIMEDDDIAYGNAKNGLCSAFWGSLVHHQMDKPPDARNPFFRDLVPSMLVCTIYTQMKPFVIETLLELRVARAIVGKAGGIVPGRPDLGEFAAMRSNPLVPPGQLNVESQLRWGRADRPGPPVKLRESLVKYLEVARRQGRGDSFFETGSRGAMAPVESNESVARGRSYATVDSVRLILGWRRDIERVLPPLLVEHFEQVDEDLRYLLEGPPSDPGGPLAPRDDDNELRDAEETFRARHLRRINPLTREGRDHFRALERLRNDEFPEDEAWESESEDEAVSDDEDEDEQDADGSRCADLFSRVGGALMILFVAVGLCVQYYLFAFPVEPPLED